MSPIWHIGRKAIISYLRPYLGLSPDKDTAWFMVRRWRIRYRLPIQTQPNGKPFLDPAEFELWWARYSKRRDRIILKRELMKAR